MSFDLGEDFMRYLRDRAINTTKTLVLRDKQWVEIESQHVKPGDIVNIKNNKEVCADIVLLSFSSRSAYAYIETANLDGEKNLKPRFCFPNVYNIFKDASSNCLRIRGKILCDKPNSDLNKFNGRLKLSIKNE